MTSAHAAVASTRTPDAGKVRTVEIRGAAGRLEALLNEGAPNARYAAVMCHPHPLGGGTMHNKVVYRAMKAMNAPEFGLGWPVLRFNFRGVGLSEGSHSGAAEWQDVRTALDWIENEFRLPVVLAGFSFGCAMAMKAICEHGEARDRVHGLAALGLPLQANGARYLYPFLKSCTLPKIFLSGDHDQFAPADEWRRTTDAAADPKTQVLIHGADHFFTGHLEAMQKSLSGWLLEQFQ